MPRPLGRGAFTCSLNALSDIEKLRALLQSEHMEMLVIGTLEKEESSASPLTGSIFPWDAAKTAYSESFKKFFNA